MKFLKCLFLGHDWEFPETPAEQPVGTVLYAPAECRRCGIIRRKLCWVTAADKKDKA